MSCEKKGIIGRSKELSRSGSLIADAHHFCVGITSSPTEVAISSAGSTPGNAIFHPIFYMAKRCPENGRGCWRMGMFFASRRVRERELIETIT